MIMVKNEEISNIDRERSAPAVSVILPCYNVERDLEDCVAGILENDFEDYEILLVDDGSTDGTLQLIRELSQRDRRVLYIHTENRGVSAARNRGIALARGEYILFVDPDDRVSGQLLSAVFHEMKTYQLDYCVFGFQIEGDRDGVDILMNTDAKKRRNYDSNEEIIRKYFPALYGYSLADVRRWHAGERINARKEFGSVWRCAYRRDLIVSNGIRMDERIVLNEDSMFNCEYMLCASKMRSINRPLYRYNLKPEGAMISNWQGQRLLQNKLELLRKRKEIAEKYKALTGRDPGDLYAGSCVFSVIEMLSSCAGGVRGAYPKVQEYFRDPVVLKAVDRFPLGGRPKVDFPILLLKCRQLRLLYLCMIAAHKLGIKISV